VVAGGYSGCPLVASGLVCGKLWRRGFVESGKNLYILEILLNEE
jgi:hypothetical protein